MFVFSRITVIHDPFGNFIPESQEISLDICKWTEDAYDEDGLIKSYVDRMKKKYISPKLDDLIIHIFLTELDKQQNKICFQKFIYKNNDGICLKDWKTYAESNRAKNLFKNLVKHILNCILSNKHFQIDCHIFVENVIPAPENLDCTMKSIEPNCSDCQRLQMLYKKRKECRYLNDKKKELELKIRDLELSLENQGKYCRKSILISKEDSGDDSCSTPKRKRFTSDMLLTPTDKIVKSFVSRGAKNQISEEMKLFIVGCTTDAMLSVRQQRKVLHSLYHALPIFSENCKMPSEFPIWKVISCLPILNTQQIVEFVTKASSLNIAVDSTSKRGKQFLGAMLFNEQGDHCTLCPEWITDSTAKAEAEVTIMMLKDIGILAEETNMIQETAVTWNVKTLKKITSVISDSCNQARSTNYNSI